MADAKRRHTLAVLAELAENREQLDYDPPSLTPPPRRLVARITGKVEAVLGESSSDLDASSPAGVAVPAYSWVEQAEAADGTLADMPADAGLRGNAAYYPAVEINGADVPIGTVVELWHGQGGQYYRFNARAGAGTSVDGLHLQITSLEKDAGGYFPGKVWRYNGAGKPETFIEEVRAYDLRRADEFDIAGEFLFTYAKFTDEGTGQRVVKFRSDCCDAGSNSSIHDDHGSEGCDFALVAGEGWTPCDEPPPPEPIEYVDNCGGQPAIPKVVYALIESGPALAGETRKPFWVTDGTVMICRKTTRHAGTVTVWHPDYAGGDAGYRCSLTFDLFCDRIHIEAFHGDAGSAGTVWPEGRGPVPPATNTNTDIEVLSYNASPFQAVVRFWSFNGDNTVYWDATLTETPP